MRGKCLTLIQTDERRVLIEKQQEESVGCECECERQLGPRAEIIIRRRRGE